MNDARNADHELLEQCGFFHDATEDWLREPDITVACGRWSEGAISELIPLGHGRLLPPIYEGCFAGVRELRLDCDADVILLQVEQGGGIACHTGRQSCFFHRLQDGRWTITDPVIRDPEDIYK